jgi:hypothetical protein
MTTKPVQSMAQFVDMLLMQGTTWQKLEQDAKREAAKRGTATLSTLGQIKAHVKYRASQTKKWKVETNESGVRMNAVAKISPKKFTELAREAHKRAREEGGSDQEHFDKAKAKLQGKTGKATGRKVTKTTENGRQAVEPVVNVPIAAQRDDSTCEPV